MRTGRGTRADQGGFWSRRDTIVPCKEAPTKRPFRLLGGLTLSAAAAGALVLGAPRSDAGADKVSFPAGYKDGVLYTIADRYDVKQYRELYASPAAAVQAAKEDKPLPAGTVLTLVQLQGPGGRAGQSPQGREGTLPQG